MPRPNTKSDMHLLNVADLSLIKDIDDDILFDEIDEKGEPDPRAPPVPHDLVVRPQGQHQHRAAPGPARAVPPRGSRPRRRHLPPPDGPVRGEGQGEEEQRGAARGGDQGQGQGKEEEDRAGGAIFEKVQDVQKVEGFPPRIYTEARQMMTVSSQDVLGLGRRRSSARSHARATGSSGAKARRIVDVPVRRRSIPTIRPRFRKARPDEEEGGGRPRPSPPTGGRSLSRPRAAASAVRIARDGPRPLRRGSTRLAGRSRRTSAARPPRVLARARRGSPLRPVLTVPARRTASRRFGGRVSDLRPGGPAPQLGDLLRRELRGPAPFFRSSVPIERDPHEDDPQHRASRAAPRSS